MAKLVSASGDYLVDSGGNNIVWPDIAGVIATLTSAPTLSEPVGMLGAEIASMTAQPTISEPVGTRGIAGVVASLTAQPTLAVTGSFGNIVATVAFGVRKPTMTFSTRLYPCIELSVSRRTITFRSRGSYDG